MPSLVILPPAPPTARSSQHQAELPALYSSFPLVICFTHDSVDMPVLLSQFVPPSCCLAVDHSNLDGAVTEISQGIPILTHA